MRPRLVGNRTFAAITRLGGSTIGRRAARSIESLNRAFENDNCDHRTNGEAWLVASLANHRPNTVIDVGANVGDWSEMVLGACDEAEVYAFEPVPETYRVLKASTSDWVRFHPRNAALTSSGDPTLRMWAGQHSTLASTLWQPGDTSEPVEVEALRGDQFCEEQGIEHIDLLKVDTEGHDLDVLKGFRRSLEDGQIDVIQFEFTLFAIYARTWLADFYALLDPLGYTIGKLYPDWIDWKHYDAHDEKFLRCNFVAAKIGSQAHYALVK